MRTKKSLLRQLKITLIALSGALLAVCFLFYMSVQFIINNYALESMEQVSQRIMTDLNQSFLQLDELSFAASEADCVYEFLTEKDSLLFYEKAKPVSEIIERFSGSLDYSDNIIMFSEDGKYYRFSGNVSNTGAKRLWNVVCKGESAKHLRLRLDGVDFIGYIANVYHENISIGKTVILINEYDIYRIFTDNETDKNMKMAFVAENELIASNDSALIGKTVDEYLKNTEHSLYEQIGFTSFGLLITYDNSGQYVSLVFLVEMIVLLAILLIILKVFLDFWRRKFFLPIQSVISEVESFGEDNNEEIPLTGLDHFDGLVDGINEMIRRIKQKEEQVYKATYSLQKAEINKQKALIVSLKKQISAHFTVNVLNIIKALSQSGENEKAGQLCDGLSFLLRYANSGDSMISGMDEFFVLEKYVDIMQIRYPNRFEVDIELTDELENIVLPRMLLQPIIENSIVHGIIEDNSDKRFTLNVYAQAEDTLKITIKDNGRGMNTSELSELRECLAVASYGEYEIEGLSHVALVNIQRRIYSYFGKGYGISVASELGEGTTVTVTLPITKQQINKSNT